ncbi:MAG: alpha/beta hydrolase [Limisphaerales bacterium]
MKTVSLFLLVVTSSACAWAAEPSNVWPDLAPGETTRRPGDLQPFRPHEHPPVKRVINITQPTFTVHLAKQPNGAGVVILPGGGFGKVVTNKEGTEAAEWLNRHGFAAFVLSYRTKIGKADPGWERPLQDSQRLMSLVRARAGEWNLKPNRIGLLGFSAGGQVAARLLSDSQRSYPRFDPIDEVSFRPDFAILVYPWTIYDVKTGKLVAGVSVPKDCPPTFIVHTDDDRSSSLGAVLFYTGLKKHGIPSELHVYGNGGHGYGLRPVEGSAISSWPGQAAHWLGRWIERRR